MIILISVFFWFSGFCLLHSYLLYPLILRIAARGKQSHVPIFQRSEQLPRVSVLLSAFNEEVVIKEKLKSIFSSDYPLDQLYVYIGSDCSTDKTNEIIENFVKQYPNNLYFNPYTERRGKPMVINDLAAKATADYPKGANHIFIITDANVMFSPEAVFQLLKHFKDQEIAIVDSNITHPEFAEKKAGIARNEKGYISREVGIKYLEGLAWGCMIGPLGGCYSVRSTYFSEVPAGYLVDDFYIAMKAFEKGGKAINEPLALCFEDVSNSISEEFRRKTRISTGNFANLATFWRLLLPNRGALAFAFLSHKVFRWLGPFFIILAFISNTILSFSFGGNLFYQILFLILSLGLFAVPLLDFLLKKAGINIGPLRYITYFLAMNAALLKGFINYLKGVSNNVWQPTKRNIE
jgi:cellulose synthase/poly-beta-1,6-N-acetylglucosamine synthase-like glycosyltransferase